MKIALTDEQKKAIVNGSDMVYTIMRDILVREEILDREREHFWILGLSICSQLQYIELIGLGSVRAVIVEPMNVFRLAVMKGCVNIILVHNHPSGNLKPSTEDKNITDKLIQVGEILNIEVFDHLIISDEGHYSFLDEGLLGELQKSTKYVPPYLLIERLKKEEAKIRKEVAKQNLQKGIDKGKKEGEKQKAIGIAKEMIKNNEPLEKIVKYTGLTKKEIEKLQAD